MENKREPEQFSYVDAFEDGRDHQRNRVAGFHRDVVGIAFQVSPRLDPDECAIRARLIAEEACETVAALVGGRHAYELFEEHSGLTKNIQQRPSLAAYCDGAADLRVVLHGTDLQLGVWSVADEVFDAVMDSNDAKKGGPKDPVTQKQLKPAGWTPPDVAGILRNRLGWEE